MAETTPTIARQDWADMSEDVEPKSPDYAPPASQDGDGESRDTRQDRSQVDPHALKLAEQFYPRYKTIIHAFSSRRDLQKLYEDTFESWAAKEDAKTDFSKVLFAMARDMKIVKVADHGRRLLWKANLPPRDEERSRPRDYDRPRDSYRPRERDEERPRSRDYDRQRERQEDRPRDNYRQRERDEERPRARDYDRRDSYRPRERQEDRSSYRPREDMRTTSRPRDEVSEIKRNQDKMSELIKNQQKMIETLMACSRVLN